jgi:hypothetical protein
MNAKRIIGPIFYAETINSDRYVGLILTEFFAQLTQEERSHVWFQQNSATAHTADGSMTALEVVLGDGIISCGLWAARSPDLTPCDFYLWGNLKDKVYRTNPHTEEVFKENIRRDILDVPQEELRVNFNLLKRYKECMRVQGHHFQHLLRLLYYCFMERYLTRIGKVLYCLAVCSSCQKLESDSCV